MTERQARVLRMCLEYKLQELRDLERRIERGRNVNREEFEALGITSVIMMREAIDELHALHPVLVNLETERKLERLKLEAERCTDKHCQLPRGHAGVHEVRIRIKL